MDSVFTCFILMAAFLSISGQQTQLKMMVLLPQTPGFPGFKFPFGAEMSGGAVIAAIEDIEAEGLLPGYHINTEFVNSKCDAIYGFGNAFTAFSNSSYDVIIGPACSAVCRMVGRLAAYLNIPCFSGLCDDIEMINKNEFPTLTRFLGSFEKTAMAVRKILEFNKWNRVSIIWEMHPDIVWRYTANALKTLLDESDNFTIAEFIQLGIGSDLTVEEAVAKSALVSRIILVATTGGVIRDIAVAAKEQGLIDEGKYIFISVDFYTQKRSFGDFGWSRGDDKDDLAKEAYMAFFFVSYYNRDTSLEYDQFQARVKNISKERFGFDYNKDEVLPYPAANLYEAVYLYAISMNETISGGGPINNGTAVSRRLWGRSFKSITGDLNLNTNGDREQAYTIKHMQDINTGDIEIVADYFSQNTSFVVKKTIVWPGPNGPPIDHPPCGYNNEFCEEDEMRQLITVLAAVISCLFVGMFVVLGVVYLLYRRFQWQKLVNEMKWKLDFGDIMQERKSRSMMRFRSNGCMSVASLGTSVSNNSVREQEYITTGQYNGVTVAMKHIKHLNEIKLTRELKIELSQLHDVVHTNILRFIGACIEPGKVHIVSEYCSKGSLQDVLENENVDLDWSFRHSLINDILKGLQYLHMSKFKCHGNLKSSNCLVDNRFSVKLGDFAPVEWQRESARTGNDLLWTAPEVLRRHCQVNQQSDIYSLAIILQEIIERKGPFYMHHDVIHTANTEAGYAADEIVQKVMDSRTHPVRPTITPGECSVKLSQLVIKCWAENPEARPKLQDVLTEFSGIHGARGKLNIMDSLMQRMEQYANNLEDLVEERTGKYLEEKKRVEELLHRLLPPVIATQIQEKGQVDPETFECVTIYFSDIVGFTKLSSMSTPVQVIDFLNDLYTMFDEIISEYDVYKVETIGDAYMVVSGLPNKNGDNHAAEISKMSLKLLKSIKKFTISHCPDQLLQLRIGLHSGPCAAGVVGLTMPRYCLFGDTVNTASRMESNGEPLKIHISNSTNEILSRYGYFTTTFRGELAIKGKGQMKTYWLDSVTDVV